MKASILTTASIAPERKVDFLKKFKFQGQSSFLGHMGQSGVLESRKYLSANYFSFSEVDTTVLLNLTGLPERFMFLTFFFPTQVYEIQDKN